MKVCLHFAQLNRSHGQQYIALHKMASHNFALHTNTAKMPNLPCFALICLNFIETPQP
jgi:hypothetical protein